LDFGFSSPAIVAVAAAGISLYEESGGIPIVYRSFAFPAASDRMSGKGRSVMGEADGNHAAVDDRVIDPVGESHTVDIGEEIMIVDRNRRAVSFGAGLLDVADHSALCRIHADDGQALALKAGAQRPNVLKLLIAIAAGVAGNRLAMDTQR
jgi:hypothetical protein